MKVKTTFVRPRRKIPAVLYEPEHAAEKSKIAVLVMHSDEDYLTCPTGEELAKRGYVVLCANVISKEGIIFHQNKKMHSVKAAIQWLKAYPGVEKVVLMGHSGGASLLTEYQAVAENGGHIFSGENMCYPYVEEEELIPADGIMLLDANWGNAVMQLFSLDPAVVQEGNGMDLDPELNLFEEKNGFCEAGSSFRDDFIRKFQKAQGKRNEKILAHAMERCRLIDEGKGDYEDDEPLCITGAAQSFFNNKLYAQDIRLMSHTEEAYPLIHSDGSMTTEIIRSVHTPENPRSFTGSFWEGARFLSVKTYLSSYAIRTTEEYGYDESHVWGIDWHSSYAAPPGNVTHIHVPTLVMGMTGGWEFLASETIYRMSASEDKSIAFVEGATHKFTPAKHCEAFPGQFGDTMKLLHDHVDTWLSSGRFS